MKVYMVQPSDLQAQWNSVHPAYWGSYYDRLQKQVADKATSLGEAVHFHEFQSDTPLGGASLLVECSDAMAATLAAMKEVHSSHPVSQAKTVRRNDASSPAQPQTPQP